MPRYHTPAMTLRRLQVVVDAGSLPNPPQAHLQDLRDVIDDVTRQRDAMNRFCDRVEAGEVRSRRTYAEFCTILGRSPKQ